MAREHNKVRPDETIGGWSAMDGRTTGSARSTGQEGVADASQQAMFMRVFGTVEGKQVLNLIAVQAYNQGRTNFKLADPTAYTMYTAGQQDLADWILWNVNYLDKEGM